MKMHQKLYFEKKYNPKFQTQFTSTVDPHLSGHLCSQADCPDKRVTFPIYNYDVFPNMCPDKWIIQIGGSG